MAVVDASCQTGQGMCMHSAKNAGFFSEIMTRIGPQLDWSGSMSRFRMTARWHRCTKL